MTYEVRYYAPGDMRLKVEVFDGQSDADNREKAFAHAAKLRIHTDKAIGPTVEVFEVTRRKIG